MKKIIALTLILTLMFAGCTSKDNNTAGDTTGNGTTTGDTTDGTAGNTADAMSNKSGLGIVSSNSESTTASADTAGNAQTDTFIAAVVFDGDGKVADISLDCVQSKTGFDATGALVGDTGDVKSKRELGDSYGMKAASGIGKEWYEQVDALEDWMKGKSVSDITSMKTKAKGDGDSVVPDDPTISSSCTISVENFLAAVEKAEKNSK